MFIRALNRIESYQQEPDYQSSELSQALGMIKHANHEQVMNYVGDYIASQDTRGQPRTQTSYALQLVKAIAHHLVHDDDAAIDELEDAIKYNHVISNDKDKLIDAYAIMALIYRFRMQYAEALTPLNKIIELQDPPSTFTLTDIAELKYYLGDWSDALIDAHKALAEDSRNKRALYVQSKCKLKLGRHCEVETDLLPAIQNNPSNKHLYSALAEAKLKQGNPEQALINADFALGDHRNTIERLHQDYIIKLNEYSPNILFEEHKGLQENFQCLISSFIIKFESLLLLKRPQDLINEVENVSFLMKKYNEIELDIAKLKFEKQQPGHDVYTDSHLYQIRVNQHFFILTGEAYYQSGNLHYAMLQVNQILQDKLDHLEAYDRALILLTKINLHENNRMNACKATYELLSRNQCNPEALSLATRAGLMQFGHWRDADVSGDTLKRKRKETPSEDSDAKRQKRK